VLRQTGERKDPRDGMDMIFLAFDKKSSKVIFSGANRPLLHMRKGVLEIQKGNKFSIGGFYLEEKVFVEHTISLEKGDCLIMFTDGLPDQMGGEKKRKLSSRKLTEWIQEIMAYPEKEQFNYLWLSPTTMKDCWFREGRKDSRFKSMTELGNPSLVIYPIGNVSAQNNAAWGNILLELITHRQSMGKPTWIVKTKSFNQCLEIKTSDELNTFLTRSSSIPTVILESDEDMLISDFSPKKSSGRGNNSSGSYNL
jgi:hypothetical protein